MRFGRHRSTTAPPMRKIAVRLSRELLFRLGQVANEVGASQSAVIRTALTDWLRDFGHKRRRQASGAALDEE